MPASIVTLAEAAALWPARGTLIGLDLGTKTIGVASSDPDRKLATGVETIARKTFTVDARRILALADERKAVGFVLGLPLNMDGSEGPRAQSTRSFARNFSKLSDLPIALWDERLTTARALGFRERMGAIPLIVDDLNNRKMAEHLPDLVKADRDFRERYAPILISTNKDVQAVPPELRKRMVVVHVAGSKPRALPTLPAQRAMAIGTALYRDYLNRMAPRVPDRGWRCRRRRGRPAAPAPPRRARRPGDGPASRR